MSKLFHLLSLTPRETWRLLRLRLPVLRNGPAWSGMDLMSSPKHRHGIRFAEFLLRQEAIVQRHMNWESLDFEDTHVVEIGCGPLGGYGPMAIFCGASCFESAEPEWDADLFASDLVKERYLFVLHADLTALYGERMNFGDFRKALQERMIVHKAGFDKAPLSGKADIILSQSCLEHVFPIETTISKLAEIQSPSTRFLHLVDFGNHYLSANPFEGLYEQPPEEYIAKRGKAINMLRVSDLASLFSAEGIGAQVIPSRIVAESYRGTIHPWWRERYEDEALFTQLALVVGTAG
jgi:hypothetical protein